MGRPHGRPIHSTDCNPNAFRKKGRGNVAKKSGWIGALACTGVLLGAGVEAQTPTTVEQLDDLVAAQATVHQYRTASDGDVVEFEMGLVQALQSVEKMSAAEIVDFVRKFRDYRKARAAPASEAPGPAVELGLEVGSFKLLGLPVSVQVSVDQKVSSLVADLWPDFARSGVEPAGSAVASTPLTAAGVLELSNLQDSYDAWASRRIRTSLSHELLGQEATARHHVQLYKSSPDYREAWDELFGAVFSFRPTDSAPTVMSSMPAFAGYKNGEAVLEEVRALRGALEEGAAVDGHVESLVREATASSKQTLSLVEGAVREWRADKERQRREASKAEDEEKKRLIRKTDRENLATVTKVSVGLLYFIAPEEVQERMSQIIAVAGAAGGVLKAIQRFEATPNGANMNLAGLALSGNIAMVAVSLFESFLGGPSTEQLILEEIAKLQEMVQQVREEMHERFDQLYATMLDGFEQLTEQHALTHTVLYRIERRLRDQLDALSDISDQLLDVRSDIFDTRLVVIEMLNQVGLRGCLRDSAYPRPELSENEFFDCLEAFRNVLYDLPDLELNATQIDLMARQLASATNLALRQLRRLTDDPTVRPLPRTVVSVRRFLGTILVLRDFLLTQAEQTEAHEATIRRSELMGQAVRYGDALNSYIRVILEELKAFHEGSDLSAFEALLAEPEAELEALRKAIAAAEREIYDGLEGLPLDRPRGAVPSWVELIEDGRCPDYTVTTDFKKSFLVDTGNRLHELVHRDDQRLARAGWGKIEVCVQSRPYYLRPEQKYYVGVSLTIDFHPDPQLGCNDATIRLFKDTRYEQAGWSRPKPGSEDWVQLFRKGMEALANKPNPTPVLQDGCRYRDHPELFDAVNKGWISDQIQDRVRTAIDDAATTLDVAGATLLSWLSTAFDDDGSMPGVARELSLPDLHELLNSNEPWQVVDVAMTQLEAVREALRSEAMREQVRLGAGHRLESSP